ncbi:pentatricopeptide repeat-containing protein At3g14330-like [Aristolochia californica]|uniref:pentatricopeptide repeat-containing protein At3g14330-like n=1 Tax=Aristolochia californica TaxID=171875 RepID=UPI0035DE2199
MGFKRNSNTGFWLPMLKTESLGQHTCTSEIFSQLLNQSLRSCKNLRSTKTLHALLLRTGFFFTSLSLHTHLILSYAKFHKKIISVTNLFKCMDATDPLPWNATLARFCHHGLPFFALETFFFMHRNSLPLDTYSLCSCLSASASTTMVQFGKQVHAQVFKSGWLASVYVGGALIDFYVKSSVVGDSAKVFDEIPFKNTICANALLSGYADAKEWRNALELIRVMDGVHLNTDRFTLSAILRVCAGLSTIALGRQVHGNIIRRVEYMENDVFLLSSLVEMYGKCGLVDQGRLVFDLVKNGKGKRDIVLWTSMLNAYGRNGQFKEVIQLFDDMSEERVQPDEIAFLAVISACSHTGNVDRGVQYFESMSKDFGLLPQAEHHACLVDLLCRAGQLEQAWEVMSEMQSREDSAGRSSGSVSLWGALLRACEACGNVEKGKLAAERALILEPENVGIYVVLSNLYAKCGLWDEIGGLRELMKERGLKKDVGCSCIDLTR